jgi:hypothetical protein
VPTPTAEVVAQNSAVKPWDREGKPDMSLNASTEVTQVNPTPQVVVLNPGTAGQKANSQTEVSAQVYTNASRPDLTHRKASNDRPSTSHRAMQNYRDLRDYMIRR